MGKLDIIAKLVDPAQMRAVEIAVTRIVAKTFHDDATKGAGAQGRIVGEVRATEAEIRRRAGIAWDWFLTMRADCGYSTQHALDTLPTALRSQLDGIPWIPPPPERAWTGK